VHSSFLHRTGNNPSITVFTYDNNGNQLSQNTSGDTKALTYDAFNHLVGVERDGMIAVYTYRADGLRHTKTVNGFTTTHLWDRGSIVLELNPSGAVINRFARGLGHLIHSNHHGFYLFNVRGDVVQRVDGDGVVIHTYRYDAFGNQLNEGDVNTNPFRFAGEYYDWETGFIYLRARFYNPAIGRFISEDPHWTIHNMQSNTAAIIQSSNLFVYCGNNPVMFVDPSGLFFVIRDAGGTYRIEAFNNSDMFWATATSLLPAGGTLNSMMPQPPNRGTIVGEAVWWANSGAAFTWDSSLLALLGSDVAASMLAYGGDTVMPSKGGAILSMLWSAAGSSGRMNYSNTILGLMEVHGINNSFSCLQSLMDQVAELDRIILNNPEFFFLNCSRYGVMRNNFNGSQFLSELSIYRMPESTRSNVLRVQEGRGVSNWTVNDANRANHALLASLRRGRSE